MITTLISLLFLLAVIMPFNKYKNYIYVIGEFVKETLETGQKAIDIVPIKWTDAIPGNSEECETLYPPPPYDDGVFKKLINLIKNNEDADLEYSMYRIKIRAFARNYKEAKMKLGVVMKQSSAFSTGSEMDTDQKAKAASEILRTIKVPNKKITFYNELQPFSDKDIKTSGSSNDYSDENLKTKQKKTKSFARKKGHDKENQIDSSDDQSENFFKSLKKKRKHEISFDERGKDILKPSTLAKPSEKDLVRQQVLTNLQPLQIPKAKIHNAFQRGPAEQPRNKLFIENLITKYSKLMDDKGGENISKKDYLALMFQGVNNIVEYHVSDVKQDCNDIVELVNKKGLSAKIANNIILNPHMLAKKYDLNLPIQTVPEFTAFCELLLTKKEFSEDFDSTLCSLYTSIYSLTKNVTIILKEFLSRELAALFTAVKKCSTKELVLKDTQFANSIKNFIDRQKVQDKQRLTSKEFEKALSDVLPNSKDWSGGRSERKKHKEKK